MSIMMIDVKDLDVIVVGVVLYGIGGGGDLYIGKLLV